MNLLLILLEVNWSNITGNWTTWFLQGYQDIFGDWVYPLIFLGLVGYVYCVNRSAISAAAIICIIFTVFGVTGVFAGTNEMVLLSSVISMVSIAGLFALLFTQRSGVVR